MKSLIYLSVLLFLVNVNADTDTLEKSLCKSPGFFAVNNSSPLFYGCYANKYGSLTLKYLSCRIGEFFNSKTGFCAPKLFSDEINMESNSTTDPNVESPTLPDVQSPTTTSITSTVSTVSTAATEIHTTEESTTETETTTKEDEKTSIIPTTTTVSSTETETSAGTETTETETTDVTETTKKHDIETTTVQTTKSSGKSSETTSSTEPETETTESAVHTTETTSTTEIISTTTIYEFICPTAGFYPVDGKCKEFNLCVGDIEKPFVLKCRDNQNFFAEKGYCDINFECYETSSTEVSSPTEITTETEVSSTTEVATEATNQTETEDSEKAAPFRLKSNKFPCLEEGTFAHTTDCKKYYECKWERKFKHFLAEVKQCPTFQVYNTRTAKCGPEGILTCLGRSIYSKLF